jgi:hypothetical protein
MCILRNATSYNGQAFGRKYLVFKDASCGVASGISGMKWKDVCRPKECDGLGAKDLRLFDMALLAKWCWCLLSDEESM